MGWLRHPSPLHRRFMAMGTLVTVTVDMLRGQHAQAEAAIGHIERMMLNFGRDGWAWGPGALGRMNTHLADGSVVEVPPMLRALLRRACGIQRLSGGLFEPRIGALVKLWGFDRIDGGRQQPPDASAIAAALRAIHAAPLYTGNAFYGPAPGVAWDLGGIGKGHIVDAALARLALLGFGNASIDAGGNLAVRGTRGDRPWRVGIRDIRHPSPDEELDGGPILGSFEVRDEAVITHGDDQRYFIHDGRRYAHLIDPRSGWPAQGLRSLTVVHSDAALADAAGGALFVAGRNGWRALARRFGITQVLTIADDGEVEATPELMQRLRPHPGVQIRHVA